MFIDLNEYTNQDETEFKKSVNYESTKFDTRFGIFKILEAHPIELTIYHSTGKKLNLSGNLSFVVEIPCDRCLTPVSYPFSVDFNIPIDLDRVNEEEYEQNCIFDEHMLDVESMVFDEMISEWPFKVICKDGCKGMCPVCGHDLNASDCGCDRNSSVSGMAAIKDIFKNVNY